VLALAAAVEARSEHPLARAIARRADGAALPAADGFARHPRAWGCGRVAGRRGGGRGRPADGREGIDLRARRPLAAAWPGRGARPVFAAVDGQAGRAVAVADRSSPAPPAPSPR
jgi:P-type Cu+ transporter